METIIVKAGSKTSGQNKFALFIGRWQPFHDGHQWLINQQLIKGQNVCIAIRDVEQDEKNIWTSEEIKKMLEERFRDEISLGHIKVICIPDIDSINIGRDVGYDIIEHTPPTDIAGISGTKIREQLINSPNQTLSNELKTSTNKDYKIRFNTNSKSDIGCWRILYEGVEFLVDDINIKVPCTTTKDFMKETNEFKYHISCSGQLEIKDGVAYIK